MKLPEIHNCPGTLAQGFDTYSPACLRQLFNGRKVSHVLPYNTPETSEADAQQFLENRKRISISGVQEKVSMLLEKNQLRLTKEGEQGTYILKPIPRDVKKVEEVPANEHLTMQIARQVYGIPTAENALIFFKSGAPAYITKRFDLKPDGQGWGKEDFASLAGKTSENAGKNYKYEYSYEGIAELMQKYVPAYRVEVEKFFQLVLFNYLFSNGDAHLKNFTLLESPNGDYLLSPAYDLLNTQIHVDDKRMALEDGLFKDDFTTESFKANGFYAYDDFLEFGLRLQITQARVIRYLDRFRAEQSQVAELVSHSFLGSETKKLYLENFKDRRSALNYSFSGKVRS